MKIKLIELRSMVREEIKKTYSPEVLKEFWPGLFRRGGVPVMCTATGCTPAPLNVRQNIIQVIIERPGELYRDSYIWFVDRKSGENLSNMDYRAQEGHGVKAPAEQMDPDENERVYMLYRTPYIDIEAIVRPLRPQGWRENPDSDVYHLNEEASYESYKLYTGPLPPKTTSGKNWSFDVVNKIKTLYLELPSHIQRDAGMPSIKYPDRETPAWQLDKAVIQQRACDKHCPNNPDCINSSFYVDSEYPEGYKPALSCLTTHCREHCYDDEHCRQTGRCSWEGGAEGEGESEWG